MIRMIQSTSAGHAKSYFSEELTKTDYYLDGQELQGRFNGLLAGRMGITGPANRQAFFALCENKHPATGQSLTPRMKSNRTIGYDINFHCPKSVSIVHVLSNDNHILDAFEQSVMETMKDIEAESKTRLRKNGQSEDRPTGELVWTEFTHQTARPVEGHAPDPHLHMHCFTFNATWDAVERKFKAAQFREIMSNMPYHKTRFHKRLADKLVLLGYQVRKTANAFELEIVPKEVIANFSKRTDLIGRIAKEKNITDAKDLAGLGARTRNKKQKGLSMDELKKEWRRQIAALEIDTVINKQEITIPIMARDTKTQDVELTHANCVNFSIHHCFERASVVSEEKLLATANAHALGHPYLSFDAIKEELKSHSEIIQVEENGKIFCTTREVLKEEKRMVELANSGKGKVTPFYTAPPLLVMKFNDGQKNAITHVLTTSNQVSIIRGAAGTGKTTLTKEVVSLIERAGKSVTMVAPTAQASRGVLKEEGFKNAETVAKLLSDSKLQDKLKGQVLIVDEAGLLGTKAMLNLLELVKRQNSRLILLGDTRQHSSVVRGDALRILNTVAGIKVAEVNRIVRQKDLAYKQAIEHLAKGEIKDGFDRLDGMGAIKAIDPMNPNQQLADDYVAALMKGKEVLVISPTNKQAEQTTNDIRSKLRSVKKLGKKEVTVTRYTNLNFTDAEKTDTRNFEVGHVLQFNQNLRKIKRGSRWVVQQIKESALIVENDEKQKIILPRYKNGAFDVFEKSELKLSKGDKVRITRNGFDANKKRLNNGMTFEVRSVSKLGKIALRNKKSRITASIYRTYGHLAHAHCITSHASQGKTVDEVFVYQPSATFAATNGKQFYVSVSRGREAAHIYTDDREELLSHASLMGDRQSALELINKKADHLLHVMNKQRTEYATPNLDKLHKEYSENKAKIDRAYEPEF